MIDSFTFSNKVLTIGCECDHPMGVVPVCTPAGGIKDVIRDGENGFLAKGFDTESLYDTVNKAMKTTTEIFKDVVIREFHDKYSMGRCADSYKGIFQLRRR